MNWKMILLLSFCGLLLLPAVTAATVVTLDCLGDSYVQQNSTTLNANFGDSTRLRVGTSSFVVNGLGGTRRAFLAFDTASIPADSMITDVVFRAYQPGITVGPGFRVFEVTSPWSERTVTWNNQPTASDTYAAIMTLAPQSDALAQSDGLTDIVQRWVNGDSPNYGLSLRFNYTPDPVVEGNGLSSREDDSYLPPQLIVTYIPEPAMLVFFAVGAFWLSRRK